MWKTFAALEHEVPGRTRHYDWLFDDGDGPLSPDAPRARTFRCSVAPQAAQLGVPNAVEFMAHHRARYLTLTESVELGGGRGTVAPIARGAWRNADTPSAHARAVDIQLENLSGILRFALDASSITLVAVLPAEPRSD